MPFKNFFLHVVKKDAYKKVLTEELHKAKTESANFHFFEEFTFDDKKKEPLLLVGTVEKSVLDEVRKASKSESHGTCAVNGHDQLEFAPIKGSPHLGKLTVAVKVSGMTNAVCLQKGEASPHVPDAAGAAQANYVQNLDGASEEQSSNYVQNLQGSPQASGPAGAGHAAAPAGIPSPPSMASLTPDEQQSLAKKREAAAVVKETRDLVNKDGKALTVEQKAIYQKAEKAIQLTQEKIHEKMTAAKGATPDQKETLAREIVTLNRQLKQAQQALGQLGWSDAHRLKDETGLPMGGTFAQKASVNPEMPMSKLFGINEKLQTLMQSTFGDPSAAESFREVFREQIAGLQNQIQSEAPGSPYRISKEKELKEMTADFSQWEKLSAQREANFQADLEAEQRSQKFAKPAANPDDLQDRLKRMSEARLQQFKSDFKPKPSAPGHDPFDSKEKDVFASSRLQLEIFHVLHNLFQKNAAGLDQELEHLKKKRDPALADRVDMQNRQAVFQKYLGPVDQKLVQLKSLLQKALKAPLFAERKTIFAEFKQLDDAVQGDLDQLRAKYNEEAEKGGVPLMNDMDTLVMEGAMDSDIHDSARKSADVFAQEEPAKNLS